MLAFSRKRVMAPETVDVNRNLEASLRLLRRLLILRPGVLFCRLLQLYGCVCCLDDRPLLRSSQYCLRVHLCGRLRPLFPSDQLLLRGLALLPCHDSLVPEQAEALVAHAEERLATGECARAKAEAHAHAEERIAAAKAEAQLALGQQLAVNIIGFDDSTGHTEYLVLTVAAAADGRRKEFRSEQRATAFQTLHEQVRPQLVDVGDDRAEVER